VAGLLPAAMGFQAAVGSLAPSAAGRVSLPLRAPWAVPSSRHARLSARRMCPQPSAVNVAMAASLVDMVAAAAPGDTITLEKGVYTLDKQLKIDKDLTVQAAANCGWGDVVITAAAPTDQGHFGGRKDPTCLGIMFNIQGYIPEDSSPPTLPEITFRGIKVVHTSGSTSGTLSNGLGSICMAIGQGARVTFERCEIVTETSTAVFCSGRMSEVKVDTCVIGPNGWDTESSSGYGVCIFREAYGEVINSDVWRQAQSGVISFNEGSTALVVECEVGPCLLGGIAAEGQRATLTAKDVTIKDIEWREVAQFDGGEVIFDDGVPGDEMCVHFRQMSKCADCAAGKPATSYAEY